MSNEKEKICRFCLEILELDYVIIEDNITRILDLLMLSLDFSVSEKPVMCNRCLENMQRAFDFKSTYISMEERYLREDKSIVLDSSEDMCQFCKGSREKNSCNSLNVVEEAIRKCFPELDPGLFREIMICTSCKESLQSFSNFAVNCWSIEENIKRYCEAEGTDSNGQIVLSEVKKFCINEEYVYFNIHAAYGVKKEQNEFENEEPVCHNINDSMLKIEQYDIKSEDRDHRSVTDSEIYSHEKIYDYRLAPEEFLNETKCAETEIKQDEVTHDKSSKDQVLIHNNREIRRYRCDCCTYETGNETNFNTHMLKHKPLSEVEVFKCTSCSYETINKYNLKRHVQIHEYMTTYKCDKCPFVTKRKMHLTNHIFTHNDNIKVTMYKCKMCTFETKHKYNLKGHMLSHKNGSDAIMHKCKMCTFVTKYRRSLEQHMLTHKDNSEVIMHKCDTCTFESKHKLSYKRHMLTHTDSSEMVVNRCELCEYETKRKEHLKYHMLLHMSSSEVAMYKCHVCTFETIHKGSLKRHALTHKEDSNVIMYKCGLCMFESRYKKSLDCHMVSHKSSSEVTMYKCEMCSFKSKYRHCLKRHVQFHRKYKNS